MQDAHGWQPISTAPRDGSEFNARSVLHGYVYEDERARFNPDTGAFEIWVDYDHLGWAEALATPTHWTFPAPPQDREDGRDE